MWENGVLGPSSGVCSGLQRLIHPWEKKKVEKREACSFLSD